MFHITLMCISHCSDNDLLPVYFIFILCFEHDPKQKANPSILLLRLKISHKAVVRASSVTSESVITGIADEYLVQCRAKKLLKKRALKIRSMLTDPVRADSVKALSVDPLDIHCSLREENWKGEDSINGSQTPWSMLRFAAVALVRYSFLIPGRDHYI